MLPPPCPNRLQTQRDLLAVLSADNHGMDLTRMGVLTGLAVGLHNLVSTGNEEGGEGGVRQVCKR